MSGTETGAAPRCPTCKQEPPANSSFCNRCGSPLVDVPVSGERRPLTVVFCDLVGSTELAQALDAEEIPLVIREYQNTCLRIIREFGGHVAEYLGDGILVYFGYPKAHEDDAIRAVNASLAMLAAMPELNTELHRRLPALAGRDIEMRIGLHCGLVVLSDMGRGGEPHRFGVGDTLNIAARVQGLAEGGTIAITEAAQRLISGAFELKDIGAHELKGIDKPVGIYLVEAASGAQSRIERSVHTGLTPLVGREQEIALAFERWEQAKSGHGQAVLLSGEPGIGKSRLAAVIEERLAGEPHTWITCRCTAQHENTAFYPIVDMFERQLGLEDEDTEERRREKVEAGLSAANIHLRAISSLIGLLTVSDQAEVETLPVQGEDSRSQLFESLAICLRLLSRDRPLVLVFEDLHWVDPSTLELLGLLLAQSVDERVLLLFTFRPEFEPPWGTAHPIVQIQLNPLTRDQVAALCTAVAGRPLPDVLLREIVAKADGVPFFAEELTKTVLEADWLEERGDRFELTSAPRDISIPSTLRESLMARLDGLGPTKELAQLCAVIGRECSFEILRLVSAQPEEQVQRGLDRLLKANLMSEEGPAGLPRYAFRHALIHETAYDSLLREDRRSLHMRIAKVLAVRVSSFGSSRPEDLARHYAQGGDAGSAVPLYQRAAKLAIGRLAHLEAIAHLSTVLELVATLPDSPDWRRIELDAQLALGTSSMIAEGQGHERVEQSQLRARDLSRELSDDDGLFRALWGLSRFQQSRGDPVASHELGRQMLDLAERSGDAAQRCWAHLALGQAAFWRGDTSGSLAHLQATIEICDQNPEASEGSVFGQHPSLTGRALVGPALWMLGQADRALEESRKAVELASEADDPFTYAHVLNFACAIHQMRGERQEVLELAEIAIKISGERGFPLYMGFALVMKGWALSVDPEDDGGLTVLRSGLSYFQDAHTGLGGPYLFALLAEALRVVGLERDALIAIESAMTVASDQHSHFWDPELQRLKAESLVALDPRNTSESEVLLRGAIEAAREQGALSFELRSAMSLYRLVRGTPAAEAALEGVREACSRFEAGLESEDLAEARGLFSAG